MPKEWAVVRLRQETYERLKQITQSMNMTMDEVVTQLLNRYEAQFYSPEPQGQPLPASPQQQAATDTVGLLWILETIVDFCRTVTTVYPDLRAECGLTVDEMTRRFVAVAQEAGLLPVGTEIEERVEESEGEAGSAEDESQ